MRFTIPALLLFGALFCSCRSTHESMDGPEPVVLPAESIEIERDLRSGVPPEFVPALDAIRLALETGDQLNARRSLALLMMREPTGRTLELAQGFERILDGRQRIAWLELELQATESQDKPGAVRLELLISQVGPEDLRLRPGGARLRVAQYAVDPDGRERRGTRRDGVPFPKEILLKRGGEPLRFAVAQVQLEAPADLLALSYSFILEILPGEFVTKGGRYLPVQNIPPPEIELVRLAKVLPTASVPPEELISYVQRGRIFVPALLERAVRIAPSERERALDLLTPVALELNVVEFELLVPALRWLGRTVRPGGDPDAWRRWLEERDQQALDAAEPDWERMDLPKR